MTRLFVLALVASLGHVSVAVAGESILTSGARHVKNLAAVEPAAVAAAPAARLPGTAIRVATAAPVPSLQQDPGNLSKSGMRRSTKLLIYTGLAVGFVASVWAIDHNVLDVTPSSLGTRQD